MIYFLALAFSVFFAHLSTLKLGELSNIFSVLTYLVLIIFVGLRVDAGYDYGSYVQLLESGYYLVLFEPVPALFGLLSNFINLTQLFFIIAALVLCVSLFFFIGKEPSRNIFIALYFSLPFCLIDSFSLVRQYLAASFFLLAYSNYRSHRLFSLFLLILGLLSHNTAPIVGIILIAIVLINKFILQYIANGMRFIPLIVAPICYLILPYFVQFGNIDSSGFFGLKGMMLWVFISLPFIINIKAYLKNHSDPVALIALVGIGVYAGIGFYGYFASRFFVYFAPFAVLFLARSFIIKLGRGGIYFAFIIAIINTAMLLYGASQNSEFDFLNSYKFYPSECMNCNIRLEDDF